MSAELSTLQTTVPIPAHVPAERVVDFDMYNPVGIEEGYFSAWLKLQEPGVPDLVWTARNGGHWIATRGRLIREFLCDYQNFSSKVFFVPKEMGEKHAAIPSSLDPPEHTPYRQILNKCLGLREIRNIEPSIRKVATDLIDGFVAQGHVEFFQSYSQIFPIEIFLTFSGLPLEDAPLLRALTKQMLQPDGETPTEMAKALEKGNNGFIEYIRPVIEARRAKPGSDWISSVVNASINDRPISGEETLKMTTLVLLGGLDTVVNFLPMCMEYLARTPETVKELTDNPSKTAFFSDELFRRFPVVNEARIVANDIERDGVELKKGEMVLVPTTLHGIDARENDDPMKIDFHRKGRSHSTFGQGAHICAGMHLARLEVVATLQTWLARIPKFRLAEGYRMVCRSGIVANVERLDLVWDVRSK